MLATGFRPETAFGFLLASDRVDRGGSSESADRLKELRLDVDRERAELLFISAQSLAIALSSGKQVGR